MDYEGYTVWLIVTNDSFHNETITFYFILGVKLQGHKKDMRDVEMSGIGVHNIKSMKNQ